MNPQNGQGFNLISSIVLLLLVGLKSDRLKMARCAFRLNAICLATPVKIGTVPTGHTIRQTHTLTFAVFGFIVITISAFHCYLLPARVAPGLSPYSGRNFFIRKILACPKSGGKIRIIPAESLGHQQFYKAFSLHWLSFSFIKQPQNVCDFFPL